MIIDEFFGDRLYSVTLDEDEYALFSELVEQREFFDPDELLRRVKEHKEHQQALLERKRERLIGLKKARAKAVPSPQSHVLHEGSHMSATPKPKTALGEFMKRQPTSSIERLKNAQRPGALQHSIERAKIAAARPIPKKAVPSGSSGRAVKAALKKSILPAGKSWASLIKRLK